MTSYTVTIAPDDADLPTTTIRLDVAGAAASIRELRLIPGTAGGLTPGELPVLDMNQLVAAVVAAVAPSSVAGQTSVAPQTRKAQPRRADAGGGARKRKGRSTSEDVAPAAPRKNSAARNSAAGSAASTPSAKTVVDKAPVAKRAAKKKTAATKAADAAKSGSRTYRRMPEDFAEVTRQAGESAAVIADHYGVPRHTAYGWIRSARAKAVTAG